MRIPRYLLILAGFFLTTHASAAVYKCTFTDSNTRQNKVIYSDAPCAKSEKQTVTGIQLKSQSTSQALQPLSTTEQAQLDAVDAAVTRAVLNQDIKLAKSLATTKEHWRLIAIAEDDAVPQPVMMASDEAVVLREAECAEAKDNFDLVSRISWRDKDLVATKKSIMYVACGVTEPVQSQPIYGRTVGGLYSGRWYHPNHAVPYHPRPHHSAGNNTYRIDHHYHGRQSFRDGASLRYRGKHFSVNAESPNVR